MESDLPHLDKTRLSVSSLGDIREEKEYWLSQPPAARLKAIELNRRMIYGTNRTTSRLQRILEIAELSQS